MRFSIRYKILVVIGTVLLLSLGSHLYLATTLFTADKLAYIYGESAASVATLSEQTHGSLQILAKETRLFVREAMRPEVSDAARQAMLKELFATDADIVRIEWFAPESEVPSDTFMNPEPLAQLSLRAEDLEALRRELPLPLVALRAAPEQMFVRNVSLPPDAALITLALVIDGAVVAVDFRADRLARMFLMRGRADTLLVDEQGIVLVHREADRVVARESLAHDPLVKVALASPVEQGATELEGPDGVRTLGAYARVPTGNLIVLSRIPRAEALRTSEELVRRSLLFAVAILLAAILASIFLSRRLSAPIQRLRAATELIGQRQFDSPVDIERNDEIGDLARAFVRMTGELKDTERQLVHSEKMAAFGQLGAGITHEVKNPITALVGFAQLAQRKLDDKAKLAELLKLIESEGLRCRDLLQNFLMFARASDSGFERLSVRELLMSTARLLRHQLAIHTVELVVDIAPDTPPIVGHAGELSQVILNLSMNAQQAMQNGGTVTLRARQDKDGDALIEIIDTGPGVPKELREKIFEPFFTTKKAGEGTGLGLSISFSIVRVHKGTLTVDDAPGGGALFRIKLPADSQDTAPHKMAGAVERA